MSRPVLKFSVLKTGFALESETRRSSAAGATRVRVLGPVARVAWPGQVAMSTKACPMPKVSRPRVALGPVAKSMAPAAPRQSRVLGAVPRERLLNADKSNAEMQTEPRREIPMESTVP